MPTALARHRKEEEKKRGVGSSQPSATSTTGAAARTRKKKKRMRGTKKTLMSTEESRRAEKESKLFERGERDRGTHGKKDRKKETIERDDRPPLAKENERLYVRSVLSTLARVRAPIPRDTNFCLVEKMSIDASTRALERRRERRTNGEGQKRSLAGVCTRHVCRTETGRKKRNGEERREESGLSSFLSQFFFFFFFLCHRLTSPALTIE